MIVLKVQICILLVVLCSHQSWSIYGAVKEFAEDVFEVVEATKSEGKTPKTGRSIIEVRHNHLETPGDKATTKLKSLMHKGMEISEHHTQLIVEQLVTNVLIPEFMWRFGDHIMIIERNFNKLLKNIEEPENMADTWNDFSVDAFVEMHYSLRDLRILLLGLPGTPEMETGLLKLLHDKGVAHRRYACGHTAFRIRKLMDDIVRTAITIEIKAIAVMTVALPILSRHGGWVERISNEEKDLDDRVIKYLDIAIETMKSTLRSSRACDPPKNAWVRDESFIEVENFTQEVIYSSPNTFMSYFRGFDCGETGEVFNDRNVMSKTMADGRSFVGEGVTCDGRLSGCINLGTIESGCRSESRFKRYEWIKSSEFGHFGTAIGDSCPDERLFKYDKTFKSDATHCACACDEKDKYDSISISLIQSDIENNMVITGLRFMRRDGIIFIQPKQGKLLKHGNIEPDSQSWVDLPADNMAISFTTWNNAFFMDSFIVPFGSVVTGVGFTPTREEPVDGFKIQIRALQFDESTGKLCDRKECITTLVSADTERPYADVGNLSTLYDPEITYEPEANKNIAVELRQTSLKQDFGQSIVPYFDSIPVETDPPSPIGGIEIFRKNARSWFLKCPGFISLQLFSLDYHKYLSNFRADYKPGKRING